jgi:MerR family transcriptional regulator, aldehyde-responsive regulator
MSQPAAAATGRYTIQQVSARSGLSEPTLRYYERIGLIDPVGRDPGSGHRRYDDETLRGIEALACLRITGMGVSDMRAYLRNMDRVPTAAADQRELFERHAVTVAEQIRRLSTRLRYLNGKVELWSARERGDRAAEQRAVADLEQAARELS